MSNVGGSNGNVGGFSGGSKLLTSVQTRTQGSYTGIYDATDGDGTDASLAVLAMTATASSASSTLVMEWSFMGGCANASNTVFIVKKAGVILSPSTDGTNGWSGIAPLSSITSITTSTTANTVVRIEDASPTAGVAVEYTVCVRSTRNGTNSVFLLNRPVSSAGADQYETGMATGTITEYYA